ncbi:sensor histidine kinase [Actinomadura formosensis]|uniref:sensor histidine kinase n=1 Tax=Actinomadura formosensis TaxID=60706 RepID=UPI001A9552F6|nr:sensor histidine kinase [Actinomadura formosensis]
MPADEPRRLIAWITGERRITAERQSPVGRRFTGGATVNRLVAPSRTSPGNAQGTGWNPFTRWPRSADAVLALAALFVTVFVVDGPGDSLLIRPPGDISLVFLPVSVVAAAGLCWRRRAPLIVLGVGLAAWAVMVVRHEDQGGLVAFIALYSVGRYETVQRWGPVGIAAAIALVQLDCLDDPVSWEVHATFGSLFAFGVWYVGRRFRLRKERTAQRLREQAAEARRILAEERTRIARELHDVVAHRVSLMTIQAGAAKAVAAQDLDGALQAMGAVEQAGRQALDELRHLLGVLRPETDLDELGPQPGLADLPRLVEQIREAGVEVALAMDGVPDALPARVDLFAYRIVQEALTNVLKHAGPGARTEVRLGTDRSEIVIEVLDDGHGTAVMAGSDAVRGGAGGHGLVGMRERALLLGGTVDTRPRPGGGFQVVAHLPAAGGPT